MAGIKISFVDDVTSFLRGTERAERALDDVAGSLDDLAADAQRQGRAAGDELTRGLAGGAQDAQQAVSDVGSAINDLARDTDRQAGTAGRNLAQGVDAGASTATDSVQQLERSFADLAAGVRQQARAAGDELGSSVERGAREASEGTEALSENAGANAKEVAASFDGSAQSISDGFQGLAAEAFEGFGPAGLAAGVAVAAGMGLITSQLEKAKEEAQETAEEVAAIASELIDLGSKSLGAEQVNDKLRELATTAEDGKVELDQLAEAASTAGINYRDFARGVAGDSDAARRSFADVEAGLSRYWTGLQEVTMQYGFTSVASSKYVADHLDERKALDDARASLLETDATLDQASVTAQRFDDAVRGYTATNEEATAKQEAFNETLVAAADPSKQYGTLLKDKSDLERAAAEATAAATKDQKDSWADYAKDVTVTIDELIDNLDAQIEAAKSFDTNLAKIAAAGGQSLADELRAKGPEVAGAVAEVIAEAGPKKQQQYIDKYAIASGRATAEGIATGLSDGASKVTDELTRQQRGLDRFTVKVDADLTDAKRTLSGWAPRVTVTPRLGQEVR